MIKYISIAVTTLLVSIIISFLRKPKKADGQIVHLPKLAPVIGAIGCVFFLVLVIIMIFQGKTGFSIFVFLTFSLLSASLIIAYNNCRIIYDEDGFTVKNFFGIKRRYTYSQMTATSGSAKNVRIYIDKRSIYIDELSIGKAEFLIFARRKYQQQNNGKSLPILRKKDIFNGNLENPGEIIFCYVLVMIILIAFPIFIAINFSPHDAEDLSYRVLSFSRYEQVGDDLVLYTAQEALPFHIDGFLEVVQFPEDFMSACENGEKLEVGYILHEPDSGSHNNIESLVDSNGTVFLTIEAAFEYLEKDMWMFHFMLGCFFLLWVVFIFVSIRVARHPEKYSKRFIRMFFRDGVLKINR